MEDLKRRKDEVVRKKIIPEWSSKTAVEGMEDEKDKDEEELVVAPRITEAVVFSWFAPIFWRETQLNTLQKRWEATPK